MFRHVEIRQPKGGTAKGSRSTGVRGMVTQDLFHKEVELNQSQEIDIEEMYINVPEIAAGLEAVKGWAFCHSPIVKWPKLGTKPDKELQFILDRYYKEYRWQCYKRGMKQYGILPWKTKDVGGWNVPWVPPIGSGVIRQYFDASPGVETMVYKW